MEFFNVTIATDDHNEDLVSVMQLKTRILESIRIRMLRKQKLSLLTLFLNNTPVWRGGESPTQERIYLEIGLVNDRTKRGKSKETV